VGVDLRTDFYVPMRYERVRVYAPMPARVFSHVRCAPESGAGLAYFDITLSDEQGRVFAEISRFTMKRLDARSALTASASSAVSRTDQRRNDLMDALLREAITPDEGVQAFDRIMAQPALLQAIASSVDVVAWQAQLDAAASPQQDSAAAEAPVGFSRPDLATEFVAPSSASERALAEIWSELVGVQQIGVHDDFFDLGGNSLVAVRLFAAMKKRFRVSLPLSTLFEAPTIRQLAALLDASGVVDVPPAVAAPSNGHFSLARGAARFDVAAHQPEADVAERASDPVEPALLQTTKAEYTPLVPIQVGSGVPFFCVHGAGGNVLNFRALAKRLAGASFYGLQAPGVTGGEPASSIEEMATLYIDAIRGLRPRGPYLLSGYSGGGLVAFEIAQRLRAAGEHVMLILLDTFHPTMSARPPSRSERFEYLVAEGLPQYLARAGKAKLARMLKALSNDLKIRYNARLGEPLPLELREKRITSAFDRAASRYVTKRYDGPVTLFKAHTVNRYFEHTGPTLGWAEFIPQLNVVDVPGDHNTVRGEPNVQVVINHVSGLIAAASRHEGHTQTAAAHAQGTPEIAAS
jgi:thioesterase domain-containing protein/acyl carrier protein